MILHVEGLIYDYNLAYSQCEMRNLSHFDILRISIVLTLGQLRNVQQLVEIGQNFGA